MEKRNCRDNPNLEFFREILKEDIPLLKMLATNGKHKSDV